MGRFRHFSNSGLLHWRSAEQKPQPKPAPDFFHAMNSGHRRYDIQLFSDNIPAR
jgi:hypothetical protein